MTDAAANSKRHPTILIHTSVKLVTLSGEIYRYADYILIHTSVKLVTVIYKSSGTARQF